MSSAEDYEAKRLANIKRNQALVAELGIKRQPPTQTRAQARQNAIKKRRTLLQSTTTPTRISARIAANGAKPSYKAPPLQLLDRAPSGSGSKTRHGSSVKLPSPLTPKSPSSSNAPPSPGRFEAVVKGWEWEPSAAPPARDPETAEFHFASHPDFTPNKSPEEILREGCFGGGYFRGLNSVKLGNMHIMGDWQELPASWIDGLEVGRYLTNEKYDPAVNKFGVACGQSIEEWEAAGWIAHNYDVRGWFQWYCRFFQGRRCDDDDRQVSRWRKAVGPTGRFRRTLLKKYLQNGVRTVWDDGEDENAASISPVVHQTCHHWAFEVRQHHLDHIWTHGL